MKKSGIQMKIVDNKEKNYFFNYEEIEELVSGMLEKRGGSSEHDGNPLEPMMEPMMKDITEEFDGEFSFTGINNPTADNDIGVSYEGLMMEVLYNIENPSSLEAELEDMSMNELRRIVEFYDLKKKRKKVELIEDIVIYETVYENVEEVIRRRKLWFFMNEIKEDKYLKKYINID